MVCTIGGEFLGPAEPRRKRHLLAERVLHFLRHRGQHRRAEDAGRDRTHADAEHRELARNRQRHAGDAGLGGGVGRLADLAFERGHRRGVDDHAALAVGARRVVLHDGRGGLVAQERADEVDVHDLGEEIAGHRAVLAEHAARRR